MKYIKTFEDLRNTEISIMNLMNDCITYNIDFFDLISEMILNHMITFQCFKIYKYDFNYLTINKSITGRCEDIKLVDELSSTYESDILVKMNNKWYELTDRKINKTQSFTLYNHKKGKLETELELAKSTKKFNI